MGKLMHNTQIKHSSHPHLLQLSSNQINNHYTCSGCNLQISSSDHIYSCAPCNFLLHTSCTKFPELITHPSHRDHPLSLLPTPIYPAGFFRCDGCAQQGTRFSYHCQFCDFDLHVLCATKPLSVNHQLHSHPLVLTFSSPYGDKSGFSCDVCRNPGSPDQWLYRCGLCAFDVHLHCATARMLQHSHSYPGTPHQNQTQMLSHSMSTGYPQTPNLFTSVGVQTYQQPQQAFVGYQGQPLQAPVGVQTYQQLQPQPQPQAFVGYQGQAPVGVQSYQMQPQPPVPASANQMQPQPPAAANQNVGPGNGLADVMVTGFVDGMMQQLGQNFVQSFTGGGGGGGDGGGGDVINVNYECSTVNEDYNN